MIVPSVGNKIKKILQEKFPSLSFDFTFSKAPTIHTIQPGKELFTLSGDSSDIEDEDIEYDLAFFCDDIKLCQRVGKGDLNTHFAPMTSQNVTDQFMAT